MQNRKRCTSSYIGLIVLSATTLCAAGEPTVTYRKVLERGDPAPGVPGEQARTFINGRSINATGQVSINGRLESSANVDSSNDDCIWAEGPGGLRLVSREGNPDPLGGIRGRPGRGIIADDASVALTDFSGTNGLLLIGEPDGTTSWILDGDPLPGDPDVEFNFFTSNSGLRYSTNGSLQYIGFDPGVGVVAGGPPETLGAIATTGMNAPGISGFEIVDLDVRGVTPSGQFLLSTEIKEEDNPSPDTRYVLYFGDGTTWDALAVDDSTNDFPGAVPGAAGTETSVNDQGQHVGAADPLGPDNAMLVRSSVSSDEVIVTAGDPVPGRPGQFFDDLPANTAIINGPGEVVFAADTVADDDFQENSLWRWTEADGLQLIMHAGDPVPGMPGLTYGDPRTFQMNNNGDVVFRSHSSGTGSSSVFAELNCGEIVPLAIEGQQIVLDSGGARTVNNGFINIITNGPEEGRRRSINDARQVALYLQLDGHPLSGVYVATIDFCPADLAGDDDTVNVNDLLALLANWGTDGPGSDLAAPHDTIDVADLLALLGDWGSCN